MTVGRDGRNTLQRTPERIVRRGYFVCREPLIAAHRPPGRRRVGRGRRVAEERFYPPPVRCRGGRVRARARCTSCGQGFVVAFSCKGRGNCPSCNGRRMAQTAAHLVDRVIPPVPVRQWVISVPKRLRCFLADRPNAVAALTRIFIEEIERLLCTAAGSTRDGDRPSEARARLGAVSRHIPHKPGRSSCRGWGRSFPSSALGCGDDIRLIAFITDPGPIRKILIQLCEPLEPPPVSPARGPPTDWGEIVQVHFRSRRLPGVG
jgi:hypothetical protein